MHGEGVIDMRGELGEELVFPDDLARERAIFFKESFDQDGVQGLGTIAKALAAGCVGGLA